MSGQTSPPGKLSPANAPPHALQQSLSGSKQLWERGELKEGSWEREELKERPLFAPIPQNIQAAAKPATAMSRGLQGEPATPKGRTKATTPMLCTSIAKGILRTMAETEGGDNMTRDDGGRQRTMTMDDEQRQRIYVTIN
jgi:hypothetical protein